MQAKKDKFIKNKNIKIVLRSTIFNSSLGFTNSIHLYVRAVYA